MKINISGIVITIVMAFLIKIFVGGGIQEKKQLRNPATSILSHSVKTVKL